MQLGGGIDPDEARALAKRILKHSGEIRFGVKIYPNSEQVFKFTIEPDATSKSVKEQGVAEEKQRLDPKCWTGYKKQGTKMKGGVRVNNCVPKESVEEDTAYAGGMGQGGNAGQSYRKYKVKPSGIAQGISETEAVNRNDGDGWHWYDIKPAGK